MAKSLIFPYPVVENGCRRSKRTFSDCRSVFNIVSIPNGDCDSSMKSTHHFRDQLSLISGWFEQWNECEQTVALYSLIKRIGPAHARFLALVLDQGFSQCVELSIQEQQANDPVYINCLSNESKEVAVTQLLSHLPLLRPGNEEVKAQYLSLIPKILAHSVQHSVHIEESRQLLSYSLIHPAITNDDRRSLTLWLRQLEDRIHNYSMFTPQPSPSGGVTTFGNGSPNSHPLAVNGTSIHSSPPRVDSNAAFNCTNSQYIGSGLAPPVDVWRTGPLMGLNGNLAVDVNGYSVMNGLGSNSLPPGIGSHHMAVHSMNSAPRTGMSSHPDGTHTLPMTTHSRVRRSSSLTPPCNTPTRSSRPPSTDWSKEYNGILANASVKNHAPLSPQSSAASSGSGSESQKDERDNFNQEACGMKDVPSWLKSLRLHKYAYIFKNMIYEEMMSLTEAKLEKMNITKGARHKIVLSIQKLKDRQSTLQSIEKDLQEATGTVKTALNDIKTILQTPIKAFFASSNQDGRYHVSSAASDSSGSDPPSPPRTPNGSESDGGAQVVAEGDITGQITRLMGKVCSSLLIMPHQGEENHNFFIMLIDKCLSHEAFTPLQKRRLFSWKQQVQKVCHPLPPRRTLDSRQNKGKWPAFNQSVESPAQSVEFITSPGSGALRHRMPLQYQQSVPNVVQSSCGDFPSLNRSSLSTVIKRPSLQDHTKPHVHVQRTNSAPVRPNPLPASVFGVSDAVNDPDINTRLESLCLSMTEHALGGLDGAVPLF